MEVSGKTAPPSGEETRLFCIPCDREGLKASVYGFCQDCQEHLCETCYKHHKRPRPLRNHVLLGRDKMPKHQTIHPERSDDRMDFCGNHKDKTLEFYCTAHRIVACYVCVTLEHKNCKVDYIPDISGQVTEQFRSLIAEMEHLMKKCKTNVKSAETASEKLLMGYRKVVEDIKLFREEINNYLDRMEDEITKEVKILINTAKGKQEHVKAASVETEEEVSCSLTLLNSLNEENKQNKLFIEMKKAEDRLPELTTKERLQDNKTEGNTCIKFTRNQKLIDLLKSENAFGTLTVYEEPSADKTVCLEYDGTISVNSVSDKRVCNILGFVMISPTKLVVADGGNNSIKLIDVENGSLLSERILSLWPRDVISLPENKLAVALENEKCIQILSVSSSSISYDRRLVVGEYCRGLAFCKGKLVLACNNNPGKVVIMNLAGDVLKVWDSPGLFNGPEKIVISGDERFLYVSDYYGEKQKFIKMDWQGTFVNVFDPPEFRVPLGIQELEDGTLLVSYRESNTILRLSRSCKRYDIKGLERGTIKRPRALAYCSMNHRLFVSCASKDGMFANSDTIKVFKVIWT